MQNIRQKFFAALAITCSLAAGSALAAHDLIISNASHDDLVFRVNGTRVPSFDMYEWAMNSIDGNEIDAACLQQTRPCLIQAYKKADNAYVGGLANYNGGSFVELLPGEVNYSLSISVGEKVNQWFIVQPEARK